ncbi:uncharacterized protein LOC135384820 [Ornithodoros turicata]|uniref:uncharacterized protein LOC135384820 n=1 Tax=Ornithodoros turicata TaxID=34597 RepID=UPI00313932D7
MGRYENLMRELALEDSEVYRRWIRMDTATFENRLGKVRPRIGKQDTNFMEAIDAGERLGVTLRYLLDRMMSLQYAFRMAHNTISNIVAEVTVAIYDVLKEDFVKVPATPCEWKVVADQFSALWQYPHCIGELDGKHVVIMPPPKTGAMYRNYKGTFSVVLMDLVDAELNFLYVDIGRKGRMNDSGVWNSCNLRVKLESSPSVLPQPQVLPHSSMSAPYVIVCDEGFGLNNYLMRPYPARELSTDARISKYRARRTAEKAFGVLCSRWQIFRAPLRHSPERATAIIKATIALHNYLQTQRTTRPLYLPPEIVDVEDIATGTVRPGSWRQAVSNHGAMRPLQRPGGNCSNSAKAVRELYTQYFSNEGQVGWQWKMI